jgi:hypothetical protein
MPMAGRPGGGPPTLIPRSDKTPFCAAHWPRRVPASGEKRKSGRPRGRCPSGLGSPIRFRDCDPRQDQVARVVLRSDSSRRPCRDRPRQGHGAPSPARSTRPGARVHRDRPRTAARDGDAHAIQRRQRCGDHRLRGWFIDRLVAPTRSDYFRVNGRGRFLWGHAPPDPTAQMSGQGRAARTDRSPACCLRIGFFRSGGTGVALPGSELERRILARGGRVDALDAADASRLG